MNLTEKSLKILAKGAIIVFIGTFISKLLSYIFRLIVARIGAEEYGVLSLGIAIFGFFSVISVFGLNQGVLRYVSYFKSKKEFSKVKGVIISALKINVFLSVFLAFLLFVLSDWISFSIFHSRILSTVLKIISFAIPADALRNIFFSTMRAFKKVEYETYSKGIIENIVKVIVSIILIYFGYGVYGATIAYLIAIFCSFLLSLYFLEKKVFPIFETKFKSVEFKKEILFFSFPLIFKAILIFFISWTDTFMIGLFKSPLEVGIYNAAQPTAMLMYVFPSSIIALLLPVLTDLYLKKRIKSFKEVYRNTAKWIFAANVTIFSVYLIFPKQILNILFGQTYIKGSAALTILSFGTFVYFFSLISNEILILFKKSSLIFYISLFGFFLNIFLNWSLIPKYGFLGAAIATSISLGLMGILNLFCSFRLIRTFPLKKRFLNIIFSISVNLIIFYLLSKKYYLGRNITTFLIILVLFFTIYIALLVITKSIEKEDQMLLKALYRKIKSKL